MTLQLQGDRHDGQGAFGSRAVRSSDTALRAPSVAEEAKGGDVQIPTSPDHAVVRSRTDPGVAGDNARLHHHCGPPTCGPLWRRQAVPSGKSCCDRAAPLSLFMMARKRPAYPAALRIGDPFTFWLDRAHHLASALRLSHIDFTESLAVVRHTLGEDWLRAACQRRRRCRFRCGCIESPSASPRAAQQTSSSL